MHIWNYNQLEYENWAKQGFRKYLLIQLKTKLQEALQQRPLLQCIWWLATFRRFHFSRVTLRQNSNEISFKYKNYTVREGLCNKIEFYSLDCTFQRTIGYISNALGTLVWTDKWILERGIFLRNGDSSLIKRKPLLYHKFLTKNSVAVVENMYSSLAYTSRRALKSTLRSVWRLYSISI